MLRHILILLIISLCLQASAIKIEGTEPSYAGKRLSFMTITDPVSRTEKQLFSVVVDASGKFSADIEVSQLIYCYVDFGIYRGKLLLMPGKDMRIQLPPLREKSFEESKNPYFEPVELWLKVEDDNALVNQVSRFENRFYTLTEKYFVQLYQRRQKNYLDTISRITEKEFARFQSPEFQQHKRLTFKALEADLMRAGREKLIATSDAENPEVWKQPAFTEFFNRLFMNTLSVESKVAAGSKLRMWVAQKNLTALKTWTESFSATTSPLADLILLKLLHDAWYSGEFSKPAIQQMVKSPLFSGNSVAEIRDAAGETAAKLSYLVKGSKAPEICLPLLTQSTYCSASSALPYQYLLFVDLEIPVCQEHVKYLKTMAEKTGNTLRILIVALPSKKINITEFLSSNQGPGITVLDTDEKSTGRKYKIRSYPAAFLLDKEHQVVLSPAKTPLDGFEHQFAALKK